MSLVSPRRFVNGVFVAVFLLIGRTAFADSISIGDTLHLLNEGGAIFGGVFLVDDLATLPPIDVSSFCVQIAQDINPSDFFTVGDISTVADDNGGPDPLDDRTAWIYSQFRAGALSAYTEDEIQAAIWQIEDEWTPFDAGVVFPGLQPALNDNALLLMNQAQNALDGGWVNQNVRVMTLFFAPGGDRAGEKAQDLLMLDEGVRIQAEAPEPATLLLMGTGAAALIRRRGKNRRNG